jgi:hypothetical protein
MDAKLISGKKVYDGFIENISEHGIRWYHNSGVIEDLSGLSDESEGKIYIKTAPSKIALNCNPGSIIDLEFQISSGETISLQCRVIWSKTRLHGPAKRIHFDTPPEYTIMGMEIIAPPQQYKKFFKGIK